jgi:hypothetical protein
MGSLIGIVVVSRSGAYDAAGTVVGLGGEVGQCDSHGGDGGDGGAGVVDY